MKIKVIYSFKHDVDNYTDSLYSFRWIKHGREDIQEKLLKPFSKDFKKAIKKAENRKDARKVIEKYLRQNLVQRKKHI